MQAGQCAGLHRAQCANEQPRSRNQGDDRVADLGDVKSRPPIALRQLLRALPSWSFMNIWCPDSNACVNACVFGPRPCGTTAASLSLRGMRWSVPTLFACAMSLTVRRDGSDFVVHLEVLATHEAGVHVDWAERDGAALLEVEVQILRAAANDHMQLLHAHRSCADWRLTPDALHVLRVATGRLSIMVSARAAPVAIWCPDTGTRSPS